MLARFAAGATLMSGTRRQQGGSASLDVKAVARCVSVFAKPLWLLWLGHRAEGLSALKHPVQRTLLARREIVKGERILEARGGVGNLQAFAHVPGVVPVQWGIGRAEGQGLVGAVDVPTGRVGQGGVGALHPEDDVVDVCAILEEPTDYGDRSQARGLLSFTEAAAREQAFLAAPAKRPALGSLIRPAAPFLGEP